MDDQGRSTLSAEFDGRVLDRLTGLESVVSSELVRQVLEETGRVNLRRCPLSHEVMLWVVLAMGLLTDLPIRQVFKASRRARPKEKTPARSSLCEARKRLGVEPVACLHQKLVRLMAEPDTPGAFYKGLRWMSIDGTVLDAPDTPANAAAFHRSSGGRGEGAFPQVRKVSLVESGTHVELALAIGGWQDSEHDLAAQLWNSIPADALLALDRGLFSYTTWKTLDSRGTRLLCRVKSQMTFVPLERLPDGSYLAQIYPSSWDRTKDRQGILVRIIEYTIDDPQRTGHQHLHRLMTNLLDAMTYPAPELIVGYHERWEHEVTLDEQKTHQDPRRAEKAAHLRSETPDGVHQELYALSLGHFVIRAMMAEAAHEEKLDPDRLSFTGTIHLLQCRLPECDARTPHSLSRWFEALKTEILQERLPVRANRINPRVIKRKMSKWNKKQARHRHPPRLTKTFKESVVILK